MITSRQNPKIKQARGLRTRKGREKTNLFLIEGIRHVGEAVEARFSIAYICYAPDLLTSEFAYDLIREAKDRDIPCYPTTFQVFESIAEKAGPQGILAIARQRPARLEALTPENFPWGAAAITPQDPGNIGTMLRTIDAVGASGLILLDGGADPWNPTCVRASMGTLFWSPVVQVDFLAFSAWIKEHGYHVYGTSAHGKVEYPDVDYTQPCILLLGSEREGLTPQQTEICERVVRLPMRGHVSSLNISVAAGIMLYWMASKMAS